MSKIYRIDIANYAIEIMQQKKVDLESAIRIINNYHGILVYSTIEPSYWKIDSIQDDFAKISETNGNTVIGSFPTRYLIEAVI